MRIGIVGGMGPLAGVYFQKLIIEATDARRDQDHVPVVCFTNPAIPDRTASLAKDEGESYVRSVLASLEALAGAGATHAVIPCNTAHAKIKDISARSPIPIIDLIETALAATSDEIGTGKKLGLLATSGTISAGVYPAAPRGDMFQWELPTPSETTELMDVIYSIKAGKRGDEEQLRRVAEALISRGADAIVLGCTELSFCFKYLSDNCGMPVFDPLRSMAEHLARLWRLAYKAAPEVY